MMNTSEEWKSLWPISSVHCPPLLLGTDAAKKVGPLLFKPQTHHHLFSIPSVSPQIPPPSLNNRFSRFLDASSSILPSTANSIASQLSSSSSNPDPLVAHNSLQLMRCPGTDSTLAFFPTGSNADQVGFIVLSVKNSQLKVRGDCGITDALATINTLSHRIVNISVSQLPDCECTSGESTIGYLLVSTTYSIYYYNIRIRMKHSGKIKPRLELVGNKVFKSSAIVNACWSPHIPEESVVLLDTGVLYFFDMDSCSDPLLSSPALTWKKSEILRLDESVISEKGGWLSSDFSWHPRILIVVHSSAVFLVDDHDSKVTRLLELGTERGENDKFLAFSVAAHDRFYFSLASNHMLYLCDIRKPMTPILLWAHNVANPSSLMVCRLSDLRSQSDDVTYSWASEAGYGILLGSFWNGEFSIFCYGPEVKESSSSLVTPFGKSFYAWGLPSNLSMVTGECLCGSCLLKEDLFKAELPDWQQNKEFLSGFGFLDKEISSKVFEPNGLGGFSLVTLTSLGNLESHKYCASWDSSQTLGKRHTGRDLNFEEDSTLYDRVEEDYEFKKVFQYFRFNWLDAYLKSDLAQNLKTELAKNRENGCQEKASFGQEFHENICQKLVTFGSQESLNIHDVFKDISLPTSIHEIALKSLWANMPRKMLRFGFCTYSDLPKDPETLGYVPCEFLEVKCDQPQLPPFVFRSPSSRSSKWSDKQKRSSSLVGPVIPIPFLMTLHKTRMLKEDNTAADSEIELECDKVMKMANQVTSSESQSCKHQIVSLAEDNKDAIHGSQNLQQFASYKPVALSSKSLVEEPVMKDSVSKDAKHTNMIYRPGQNGMKEVFNSHCGLKFKDDVKNREIGQNELKALSLLKRQFSNFKKGFSTYQEFKAKSNIHKP